MNSQSLTTLLVSTVLALTFVRAEEPSTDQPAADQPAVEQPATSSPETHATDSAAVIPVEDTAAMESKIGSEVVVEGMVKRIGKAPNDSVTFLNFGDSKSGFVAIVFRAAYDKFPEGFDKYTNLKVRVRGTLEKYKDRQIEIKITTPDQLELIEGQ
ncbi:MAG: hypothetical protein RIR25_1724 [Verrucomicrobiota bacterium]